MDPATIPDINQEALDNLSRAWPGFENAEIEEAWAGLMDITPDSNPVIDRIEKIPGLTIATGMSGHGFGTGPAAGELAADLVSENPTPLVSPLPYAFSRL
jgi:glycine/D-amino acid oxidase-like deaminating enzyme